MAGRVAALALGALVALTAAARCLADEPDSAACRGPGAVATKAPGAIDPDAPAGEAGTASPDGGRSPGFVVRRVPNPRFRPPLAPGRPLAAAPMVPLRALDRMRAQVSHRGAKGPSASTLWELSAGEQYRRDGGVDVRASGESRLQKSVLRSVGVDGRRGGVAAGIGDLESISLERLVSLYGLRGGLVRDTDSSGTQWLAIGGVPTPVQGTSLPRIAVAGVAVNDVALDEARLGVAVLGFGRGAPREAAPRPAAADTSAGRGVATLFTWGVPLELGRLGGRLGAQLHDLDGHRVMAAQEGLEWRLATPGLVASVRAEGSSRRARIVQAQRLAPAPRGEAQWSVQNRWLDGRAESHFEGVVREGGDPELAARTLQLGASASPRSSWYCGAEAAWNERALTGVEERRLAVHAGRSGGGGRIFLARGEWARSGQHSALTLGGEASLAPATGLRVALEPRVGWDAEQFGSARAATSITWTVPRCSARFAGMLAVSAQRDDRFRGAVREAGITLSWLPRPGDRGDLELRRSDGGGTPDIEYSATYEAQLQRYEYPARWSAARDSGRVEVRVVQSDDRAGLADVMVSLDGTEVRFTDADGVARFGQIAPGVHVVAVEERSLPAHCEVIRGARVFVTVERGMATPVTTFEIARPVRRSSF